jgi:hypothetical protein
VEVIINASRQADKTQIESMAVVRLLKAFAYVDDALPVAELLARYHGLSGVWTVLSPVHWEATHNDALMMLSGGDSRDLFDAFQSFLAEENMQLYYHDATTWLLQCNAHPLPHTKPLHAVLQQSMRPILKSLETEPFWLRFLTEAQMFLSGHQHAINGVWFWGESPCHAPYNKPLVVYGDDAWLAALQLISTDVSMYQAGMKFRKQSICFMPADLPDDVNALASDLSQQQVYWSWNDISNITKPKRFWTRFRGK